MTAFVATTNQHSLSPPFVLLARTGAMPTYAGTRKQSPARRGFPISPSRLPRTCWCRLSDFPPILTPAPYAEAGAVQQGTMSGMGTRGTTGGHEHAVLLSSSSPEAPGPAQVECATARHLVSQQEPARTEPKPGKKPKTIVLPSLDRSSHALKDVEAAPGWLGRPSLIKPSSVALRAAVAPRRASLGESWASLPGRRALWPLGYIPAGIGKRRLVVVGMVSEGDDAAEGDGAIREGCLDSGDNRRVSRRAEAEAMEDTATEAVTTRRAAMQSSQAAPAYTVLDPKDPSRTDGRLPEAPPHYVFTDIPKLPRRRSIFASTLADFAHIVRRYLHGETTQPEEIEMT
ncbi:hypothetical protein K438DRAFT_1990761 [Mycena galopus ATCC 62051]|nr:hypothetical protein K438DRAFT_1990761 [Mycena galopus ATCC 62051]